MMKCDERKREMFSRRACSESGPHPSIPGSGPVGSGHLWGKRNQGRTSAPVVGDAKQPAIILKTRRSWPVAPIQCRSVALLFLRLIVLALLHQIKIEHGQVAVEKVDT
ncbi:hypothetical protein V1478_009287 [Vespula squamosa]|uniref:Uncharacterized protein n=1 Tax=Vespula squamosa TaxID=30214 RepID=A0ABD2AP87_VESSQ